MTGSRPAGATPLCTMFDGHNLFFDSTATYGTCWGLKEYMDAHPQAIIVAPECNHEATPGLKSTAPTTLCGRNTI